MATIVTLSKDTQTDWQVDRFESPIVILAKTTTPPPAN